MKSTPFSLKSEPPAKHNQVQTSPEVPKNVVAGRHFFTDKPKDSVSTQQFFKANPAPVQPQPAAYQKQPATAQVSYTLRKENVKMKLTDGVTAYDAVQQVQYNLETVYQLQEQESAYAQRRFYFLRELTAGFTADLPDSREGHIFSPQTLINYELSHYSACMQENTTLTDMHVLMDIIKRIQKKQRLNLRAQLQFCYPYYRTYAEKPEHVVSGDLDSELAALYTNETVYQEVGVPFIQFQTSLQDSLNKFTETNIKDAALQIAYATIKVFNSNETTKMLPKAILYYLFDRIITKAGLEKNFLQLYVKLIALLADNEDIIDLVLSSKFDQTTFLSRQETQAPISEQEMRKKKRYAIYVAKELIYTNIDTQLSRQEIELEILAIRDGDSAEKKQYKLELANLFRVNLYKFLVYLFLGSFIDRAIVHKLLSALITYDYASCDRITKQYKIKIICEAMQVLLQETTWRTDYKYASLYTTQSKTVSDLAKQYAAEWFTDAAFHEPFLTDFLGRVPEEDRMSDRVVPKNLLQQRDLGRELYYMFEEHLQTAVKDVDELTGFYVREISYGMRTKFVDSSAAYKLYVSLRQQLLYKTKAVARPAASRAKIQFSKDNVSSFLDALQDGSFAEAVSDVFGASEEEMRTTSWKPQLLRLLILISELERSSESCFVKLLKFLQQLKKPDTARDLVFSSQLVSERFMPLVFNAISLRLVKLREYLQFLLTFPDKMQTVLANDLFENLLYESEEQDSSQLFAEVCEKDDVFAVVNCLLQFRAQEVTLENAHKLMRQYNIADHFANYCHNIGMEELQKSAAFTYFLQDSQFYQQLLLRSLLQAGESLAIEPLVKLRIPPLGTILNVGLAFWREKCQSDDALLAYLREMLRLQACSLQELRAGIERMSSYGLAGALKRSAKIATLWAE